MVHVRVQVHVPKYLKGPVTHLTLLLYPSTFSFSMAKTNGDVVAGESPLQLAESILSLTQSLVRHSYPLPNFSASSPQPPLTSTYESIRFAVNTAALDLLRLINGPKSTFRTLFTTHYDLAAYQVALEFKFFELVPLEGEILIGDLSIRTGVAEDRVRSVMRILATQRVFKECAKDVFEHTSASAMVAREPLLRDAFLMQ